MGAWQPEENATVCDGGAMGVGFSRFRDCGRDVWGHGHDVIMARMGPHPSRVRVGDGANG